MISTETQRERRSRDARRCGGTCPTNTGLHPVGDAILLRSPPSSPIGDTDGVQRLSLCVVAMILASVVVASAQAPNGGGPGPVLGTVEIPDLFSIDPEKGGYAPRAVITIYTRPDSGTKAVADITSPQAIDEAEYGYEEAGALVYGRARGYFLIRSSRGVGWLSPEQAGSFHSLETLITSELTYVTDAWDRFVHASPRSARRTRVIPQRSADGTEGRYVRVKTVRSISGELWLEVELISHNFCLSDQPPAIKARGWVRAHDATGAPTVWFPSRGC